MPDMTKGADFEAAFGAPLTGAGALSDQSLAAVNSLLPDDFRFATMPHGTLLKLHLVATANYRAGLVCLRSAETSVVALSLLRGLLEAFAHVAFIGDESERGDPRCRALRFERGLAHQWDNNVHGPIPGFDEQGWRVEHDQHVKEIEALWTEYGCGSAARDRTQGQVEGTLKRVGKTAGFEWLIPAYRAGSGAVPMYASDFLLHSDGAGTSQIVWARPSRRAGWFTFLCGAYGNVTEATLPLLDARRGGALALTLHENMRRLISSDSTSSSRLVLVLC